MKKRFNPFPPVSSKYGAPMGRGNSASDNDDWTGLPLCVSRPQGEYDSGGAYWGLTAPYQRGVTSGPVWAVWVRKQGPKRGVRYVRAWNRDDAKARAINGEY
jgi:hypothetical protein